MDLRSPTMLSPTSRNASGSERPPASMLTLYWPTAITIAKPHVLSSTSPRAEASPSAGGSPTTTSPKPSPRWLLGWNPRGLVVVVGAVLEVPTLSACQSVLGELHRDPPMGCDQSVMKYLRILGRLDHDDDAAGSVNPSSSSAFADGSFHQQRSLRDEEDEIQTNRLKNTEDIWIELSTARDGSDDFVAATTGGANANGSAADTVTGPVAISDLYCCGYRQPVSLVTVRYDPSEQYPTGVCTTTPLATVGAIMSQAVTDGSTAKMANLVLAPGARSRLEGKYVSPIVRQLCAPPQTPTTATAPSSQHQKDNSSAASPPGSVQHHQSTTSGASGRSLPAGGAGGATPPNTSLVGGNGSFARLGGDASTPKANLSTPRRAAPGDGSSPPSPTTAQHQHGNGSHNNTPRLAARVGSSDHVSAMAAEMLQNEQGSSPAKALVGASTGSSSANGTLLGNLSSPLSTSTAVPRSPQRRSHNSTTKGGGGGSSGVGGGSFGSSPPMGATLLETFQHRKTRGLSMTGSGSGRGVPNPEGGSSGTGACVGSNSFEMKSSVSVADAATNDSFGSNHSFGGQVHAASGPTLLAGGSGALGVSPNGAPRLRYDTYESFTEFSVILKCCNTSAAITECLFEMEETLAAAEEEVEDSSTPASAKKGGKKNGINKAQQQQQMGNSTDSGCSAGLVSPQSSMRRRRRETYDSDDDNGVADGGALLSPTANAASSPTLRKDRSSSSSCRRRPSLARRAARLAVAAERIIVPLILTIILPFLAFVRDYSYVARHVEYRAMEVVNALSIVAGKATACGLHPTVPHSLEGTTPNQRYWCAVRCFLQIGIDVALGVAFSAWLSQSQDAVAAVVRPAAWHGLHDMHVRYLDWFEGWPGGFKMNDDLNVFISFFTRLFLDVWRLIVTIGDGVDWIGIGVSALRVVTLFGLSFGLNFVSDCCNVATLHLRNAFHILRAVYVWFGSVIRSLTLQFRGKRVNPLRSRVDDFVFENDQAVIGMLMCTCVLFLFPTLALHYFYLAVVRTSVWFVQEFFCALGFIIGNAPVASVAFWALHRREVVKGLSVERIRVDAASGSVEMTLTVRHMPLSEALIDWLTLVRVVTSPLQPQKLLSFIVSAALKPAINARHSVYAHLCADCVSPCLGPLAAQTSQSS